MKPSSASKFAVKYWDHILSNRGEGRKFPMRHSAFTLLELLVVIAVIAILAAILLPVLDKAKQRALGHQCLNNLHEIGLGLQMYCDDNHGFFPLNLAAADSDQTRNWVAGRMDEPSQDTNSALLIDSRCSQMAVYIRNPVISETPRCINVHWTVARRIRDFKGRRACAAMP